MKITFVSNYINHHQMPVSNRLYEHLGADYTFIQTEPMEEERLRMGWGEMLKELPYLKCWYEEPEACRKLVLESDVVVFGGTDDESYIQERLQAGRLVIRYSERLYKTGQWKAISPRGLRRKYLDHTRYRKSPVYLLCAGGYVPSDFHLVRAYPGKMFQWGYFPEMRTYNMAELMAQKVAYAKELHTELTMLWAGRFIDWKHAELPLLMAAELKKRNVSFRLQMIGGGEMEEYLLALREALSLEEEVTFLGFQTPEKVREYMEKSQVYLLTSDFQEGWGAVLNEAMNSGCAVIASHGAGATPYLVRHGLNGLVFKSGSAGDLTYQVMRLLTGGRLSYRLGMNAYDTIVSYWNAQEAADRLLELAQSLCEDGEPIFFDHGPLSPAPVIAQRKMLRVIG